MTKFIRYFSIAVFCAVIGAAAGTSLLAQSQPPVYVIIDISEITDADAMAKAVASAGATAGARFLVRTQKATALDGGAPPARFALAQFDSEAAAKAWFNSPGVAPINAARLTSTKSRAFLVEGLSN